MMKACTLLAIAAAAGCHRDSTNPQIPPAALLGPAPTSPQSPANAIARGKYVAEIAGCTSCHGTTLAGGTEVKIGEGVARMPNITPDRETGIGAWSDVQVIAAIRQGTRADGARLAPVMPYPFYNRMTDDDALAVVAYLRAQPAVHAEIARSEKLPMQPVDVPAPRNNVDRVEDLAAHGEYVARLMHCGACHTPTSGVMANQAFAGGTAFGDVIAPNITPDRDTGIGNWSDRDLIGAIREMKDPSGRALRPPMASYREGFSHLDDSDAHALVFYLRAVPPVRDELPTTPHQVSVQP